MSRKAAPSSDSTVFLFFFHVCQGRDEKGQNRSHQHTDQKLDPVPLICHGRCYHRGDVGCARTLKSPTRAPDAQALIRAPANTIRLENIKG